jgi:hypothetical protein
MNDFRPLGKALPPPSPPKKPDVIERIREGLWRVNGKLQTNRPQEPLPEVVDIYLYTPSQLDMLRRVLTEQEDDGYPLNEWGVM